MPAAREEEAAGSSATAAGWPCSPPLSPQRSKRAACSLSRGGCDARNSGATPRHDGRTRRGGGGEPGRSACASHRSDSATARLSKIFFAAAPAAPNVAQPNVRSIHACSCAEAASDSSAARCSATNVVGDAGQPGGG
eukprot:133941-Chlamydomonas_euryale.AAC.6